MCGASLEPQSMHAFLVFLGAGIGGVLRHFVGMAITRLGSSFPWGTLTINVTGSIAMGLVVGWFAAKGDSVAARLFLATGVLGGYTTFSTFSLEAVVLLERGDLLQAFAYVFGSAVAGVAGLFLALLLMRQIL